MKRYTSFDEIDTDLRYLRLKSQIDMEEIKLNISNTKEEVKETFSPMNLAATTLSSFIRKAFVVKVVDKLLGINLSKK